MMQLLAAVAFGVVAVWGVVRAIEQAIAMWIRRATRSTGPAVA